MCSRDSEKMDDFSNVFLVCSEMFLCSDLKKRTLKYLCAAYLKLRCFCSGTVVCWEYIL